MKSPRILQLIRPRAPYLKAQQDAFASSLPVGGRFIILSPLQDQPTPADSMPCGPNIDTLTVESQAISSSLWSPWKNEAVASRLPSSQLWRSIANQCPDLIWMHEYSPFTLTGLIYSLRKKIPVVVSSEIGLSNAQIFSLSVRIWHAFWGKFVSGHIANCPAACQPLSRTGAPVISAFHAVDSRVFTPADSHPSNSALTFVFMGHLVPRKGLDLLFKAAQRLRELTSQPFRIRIIGKGDEQTLRTLAAGLEIEFTGFLSGVALRDAVRSADVFVLPTRQDTYAAVTHEAACLGLPLIISKYAGSAAAIVEGHNAGFVIDPQDTATFAQSMLALFDPEMRRRMAHSARLRGEELSAHRRGAAIWEWMRQHFFTH